MFVQRLQGVCFEDPSLDLWDALNYLERRRDQGCQIFFRNSFILHGIKKKKEFPDHLLTVRVCAGEYE